MGADWGAAQRKEVCWTCPTGRNPREVTNREAAPRTGRANRSPSQPRDLGLAGCSQPHAGPSQVGLCLLTQPLYSGAQGPAAPPAVSPCSHTSLLCPRSQPPSPSGPHCPLCLRFTKPTSQTSYEERIFLSLGTSLSFLLLKCYF